jgi:recombination protein RecR
MPEALKRLIHTISLLPGIGENRATKLAFFLLSANEHFLRDFQENIASLKARTGKCDICAALTDAPKNTCNICDDSRRNHEEICVVEEYLDPVNGVFVGDLNFSKLFTRIQDAPKKIEILIASNPNLEGEATASFLIEEIEKRKLKHKVRLTRLSR